MTVRPRLPLLLAALLLGLAVPFAIACGESDEGLLSPGRAEGLKANLADLERHVDAGRCTEASAELENLQGQVADLPASTDPDLRATLEEGVANLASIAPRECSDSQTQETEPPTTTETEPPPTTTTAPPTTTETAPPPTTTEPPPTTTEPPPETAPPEETPPESPPGGEQAPGAGFSGGVVGRGNQR